MSPNAWSKTSANQRVDLERDTASRSKTILEIGNVLSARLERRELLDALFACVKGVLEFDIAGLSLVGDDGVQLMFAVTGDPAEGHFAIGQPVDTRSSIGGDPFDFGRPLLRRDLAFEREYIFEDHTYAEGSRSHMIVPLRSQGRSIGSFGIASHAIAKYDEDDLRFLGQIGNQLALAVSNMLAYEKSLALKAQVEAMSARRAALLELNNAIITSLDRKELLTAIVPALERNVPFEMISLSVYDAPSDTYTIEAIGGSSGSQLFKIGQVIGRQDGYVADEFDMEHPLLRSDLEVERTNHLEEALYSEGMRSFCAVPLRVRGDLLGALCVGSKTAGLYGRNESQFLQEIGNQIALAIANATAYEQIAELKSRLQAENVYLQEEILQEHNFEEIIGSSPALLAVLQQIERVAPTSATVLISGETGTGKELIARAIHNFSERSDRPLVKINCGAISAGLVESELFGHVRGAFTGATEKRIGRFALADGGTIFLDEVGELSLETQVKLLRVLQEGEYEPVGSSRTLKTDVRVIAATNRDLMAEIDAGRFRLDLYYRLNVFPIRVPPLRHRREDIPALVLFFVERFAKKFGKRVSRVPAALMDTFLRYRWKGNIRELQNLIERAVVLSDPNAELLDGSLIPDLSVDESLIPGSDDPVEDWGSLTVPGEAPLSAGGLKEMERQHIISALDRTGWVIEGNKGAAALLAIHPNTLRSRMKRLGIERPKARQVL